MDRLKKLQKAVELFQEEKRTGHLGLASPYATAEVVEAAEEFIASLNLPKPKCADMCQYPAVPSADYSNTSKANVPCTECGHRRWG